MLYGQSNCRYHSTVANPYYLIKCEKKGVISASRCIDCNDLHLVKCPMCESTNLVSFLDHRYCKDCEISWNRDKY